MSKLLTEAVEPRSRHGRYLLVCATGKRSAAAADLLRSQGFRDCRSLRGGLKGLKVHRLNATAMLRLRPRCCCCCCQARNARHAGDHPLLELRAPARNLARALRRAAPRDGSDRCARPSTSSSRRMHQTMRNARPPRRGALRQPARASWPPRMRMPETCRRAAAAYRRAHACRPRDADILGGAGRRAVRYARPAPAHARPSTRRWPSTRAR